MVIETSFSIGDVIYVIQYDTLLKKVLCPACEGEGKHTLKDGTVTRCPKCNDGYKNVREKAQYHVAGPLTIGKVSVEITESQDVEGYFGDNYKSQSKRVEAYMCQETGVGSGTLYYLNKGIFASREDAQAECDKRNEQESEELRNE